MKNPAVSIIIPIYNVEKFLPRCLDSVLNQTFKNFEIIAVNDESPDKSGKILAKYAARHPNIKIITQKNAGVSAAKNTGFAAARGEFVYFLDSDDFIHPQLFEITVGLARRHRADVVTFVWDKNLERRNGSRPAEFPKFKKYDGIDDIRVLVSEEPTSRLLKHRHNFTMYSKGWTRLMRRSIVDKTPFVPGIIIGEDLVQTATMLRKNPRTVFTNENLAYYSDFANSVTRVRITAQHIESFRAAHNIIHGLYKDAAPAHKKKFIKWFFNDARAVYRKLRLAPAEKRAELLPRFADWLRDMDTRDWLRLGKLSITRVVWLWRLNSIAKQAR